MSAGVQPPPKGLQMPPQPVAGTDGFSTYGASASASSALGFSEVEEEENRFITRMGEETEVERERRRITSGNSRVKGDVDERSATPTAPGMERRYVTSCLHCGS